MFSIDMRSREPIHTQLEKSIVKYINLGVYEKDSALPSVRALACELGINPNTVSKAYKNLEQQGVIYTVAGKGVFVASAQRAPRHWNDVVCLTKSHCCFLRIARVQL